MGDFELTATVETTFERWLNNNYSRFQNLTDAVASIVTNLLTEAGIDHLSVTGRTKDKFGCLEKAKRKGYPDPSKEMTDISGVRIIVFFEGQIDKVSKIITDAFRVDQENSSNADSRMSTNQVGYRSVHFVCDLGDVRRKLPEYAGLHDLKFEFQVRTVLQHAWAELAHDRDYKFSGSLPRDMERKLFLLAGLLETADQGFQDLSTQIDDYMSTVTAETTGGDLDIEVNSLSLTSFVENWAEQHGVSLFSPNGRGAPTDLVRELKEFGIVTLAQLQAIIPEDYTNRTDVSESQTIFGLVRRWMLINDPQRFIETVSVDWTLGSTTLSVLERYHPKEVVGMVAKKLSRGVRHVRPRKK